MGLLIVPSLQALFNFPGVAVQRRGFLTAMLKRTIGELQVELFNHLRTKRLYDRLINVALEPSDAFSSGWRAEVTGEFTVEEHDQVNEIVRDLQRRYSLAVDPLRAPPGDQTVG